MNIKKKTSIIIFIASILGWMTIPAFAQGETGAQFLEIGVGAKASAMGKAFTALADDPSAIYWNPAGIAQSSSFEIMASQNFWLIDMTSQFSGLIIPTSIGVFGAGIVYSSTGDIPKYENFEYIENYSAYDLAGMFAYARPLFNHFYIGATLKLIQQKIEEESAGGFAVDLGLLYKIDDQGRLGIGFTVQNFGSSIKFIEQEDPLPLNVKGGVTYKMGALTFAGDVAKLKDDDIGFGGGAEFMLNNMVVLRGGYNSANSYSVGAGINWKKIAFSYSYVPYSDIDDSHRMSVGIRF